MRLEAMSLHIPHGLNELLADLGAGENGFGGTSVHSGELSLEQYLQKCIDMADETKALSGFVHQTTFWVLDESDEVIGMVRVRHYLNESLKERGGHISYYIRKDKRNKGYGREVLRLALAELRKIGETRALITVDMDNIASIKVIEGNGRKLESEGQSADGKKFGRFWIETI